MIKANNNFFIGAIRIIIFVPYIPGRTDTGAAVFLSCSGQKQYLEWKTTVR
jgi:hypothetical protein